MNIEIFPSTASGKVTAPCSKSYAHRLFVCAALSNGTSVINNITLNDDICATIECLEFMGARITVSGETVSVKGIGNIERKKTLSLFCNESGSTLRFLIPISLVFAEKIMFTGKGRLLERPQTVYEDIFKDKDCVIINDGEKISVSGKLAGGKYKIRGDVSSQFITGLFFTLPLLDCDSEIILTTPLQSEPYVNITTEVLNLFGVEVSKIEGGYFVKGNQTYKACNLSCEGDWSNSAFLHAFNLLGGNVTVDGLTDKTSQGDAIYKTYYNLLQQGKPTIDISDCPDLGPILMVAGAMLNGVHLVGTQRLKIKESDRGNVVAEELVKFGCNVVLGENYIDIEKQTLHSPVEAINCHNDHRVAMSFAVMCSKFGGTLKGAQCVNKSYPRFFQDIKKLGITYKIYDTQE